MYKKTFESLNENQPGDKWLSVWNRTNKSYKYWFEEGPEKPSYLQCKKALQQFMPEFVPIWEKLTRLAGDEDWIARMLSLYNPTPFVRGCTQAVWVKDEPLLIRNYDFHPDFFEAVIGKTRWGNKTIMGMNDCLWGLLDGMNEDGLCVSLAYGGQKRVGNGFGIPLVIRYVLEMATSVKEAIQVLKGLPSNMSYNITLTDVVGDVATVFLNPDNELQVSQNAATANHQIKNDGNTFIKATKSREREQMAFSVIERAQSEEELIPPFFMDPLFSKNYAQAFGTLYTAVYKPLKKEVDYLWMDNKCRQSLEKFNENNFEITYN